MRRVTIHRSCASLRAYNLRHYDTSMSPKTADYFPSGGVIATLLGNCKVLCYANMNITLFRVSANQISLFSIHNRVGNYIGIKNKISLFYCAILKISFLSRKHENVPSYFTEFSITISRLLKVQKNVRANLLQGTSVV